MKPIPYSRAAPRAAVVRKPPARAGFTLLELTISAILLAVVMATAIPTVAWIVRQRQASDRQQLAVLAVGNLMERLTALPWDELTTEGVSRVALPEGLSDRLPDARLEINVSTSPDEPQARRVSIILVWDEPIAGTKSAPIRLTAWVYRPAGGVS